jgi:hypothetical protein
MWCPTLFAKNAKRMGHGAIVGEEAKSKCRSFDSLSLRFGSLRMTSFVFDFKMTAARKEEAEDQ